MSVSPCLWAMSIGLSAGPVCEQREVIQAQSETQIRLQQ